MELNDAYDLLILSARICFIICDHLFFFLNEFQILICFQVLSLLPPIIVKLLEWVGFSGDRVCLSLKTLLLRHLRGAFYEFN